MYKRLYTYLSVLTIAFIFVLMDISQLFAQDTAGSEFTLEEITVTAEKRAANVQSIAASVQALTGNEVVEQGKTTVSEILENVPNLVYSVNNQKGRGGPDNNITIRGIKRTQEAGGAGPIPSATSTYVDGVFDSFGGEYDIERVEILRGPQGTLYGRSATGGVVSFYTNNPKLGTFGGDVTAEFSSGSRINTQASVNVPLSDKVALRAAVHYLHQEYGYRFNDKAGGKETREARIKALFQPAEQFSALLTLAATDKQTKNGGREFTLHTPDEIDWKYTWYQPGDAIPDKFTLASLELNYNLSGSAVTYIGAMHTHDYTGTSSPSLMFSQLVGQTSYTGDPDKTQTHEIRWASNTDSRFSWLIGGNYYYYKYDWNSWNSQLSVIGVDIPATKNVPGGGNGTRGNIKDYGIFTEQTFKLSNDMRITGGLRFDKTDLTSYIHYSLNINSMGMMGLNPPNLVYAPGPGLKEYLRLDSSFSNVTYKLRFEYDVTPHNMLYAMTATGFLPGNSIYSPNPVFGEVNGLPGIVNLTFTPVMFKEEKLTSYEVGSKNRFLDNRLQVNTALFYEDYEGYQEAMNVAPSGLPAIFAILRLPVKIYGLDADLSYLLAPNDKVTLTAGWMKAEATEYPEVGVPGHPGQMTSAEHYMVLKKIPGLPNLTANLTYDHTFLFGNGSSLVPRAELRYTGEYYLNQLTEVQRDAGWLPYLHQDSVVLLNLGVSWFSPQSKYSMTGYVRNATDELYKINVVLPMGPTEAGVTVGDPRTYGIQVGVKF